MASIKIKEIKFLVEDKTISSRKNPKNKINYQNDKVDPIY